jgi:CelD/BcsL family acetyltransferase involved in cellulose biosynthesis
MIAADSVPSTAGIAGKVIRDYEDLKQLEPGWAGLFSRAACDNVFLSIDWIDEWWRRYGKGQSLFVIALHDAAGQLIGVAPFCIGPALGRRRGIRGLKFLGSKWVSSDHLDLLVEPGFAIPAAREVGRVIMDHRREWDYIELSDCDEASPTMAELWNTLARFGRKQRVMRRGTCPYIPLPESFQTYLAGLNSNWRRNFRHGLRTLQKAARVRFSVFEDVVAIQERFAEAMRLHQSRFEERGEHSTFLDEAQQAFHSAVLARMASRGWVRLFLLEADGKAIAAYYGFSVRSRFLALQSGFDPAWSRHSAGLVMVGLAIEESIRSGHKEFDFLRGNERYKFHWTGHVRQAVTIRFFNDGPAGSLMFAVSCMSITWAAARRVLRRWIEGRPALSRLARRVPAWRSSLSPEKPHRSIS